MGPSKKKKQAESPQAPGADAQDSQAAFVQSYDEAIKAAEESMRRNMASIQQQIDDNKKNLEDIQSSVLAGYKEAMDAAQEVFSNALNGEQRAVQEAEEVTAQAPVDPSSGDYLISIQAGLKTVQESVYGHTAQQARAGSESSESSIQAGVAAASKTIEAAGELIHKNLNQEKKQ